MQENNVTIKLADIDENTVLININENAESILITNDNLYTKSRFLDDELIKNSNDIINKILEEDFVGISLKDGDTDEEKTIGKIIYDRIKSRIINI